MVDPPAIQFHWAGRGHHLQIAEIAVPSDTAHVRKTEALNRCLLVRVSGSVIAFERVTGSFGASSNRIGAELYHPKWRRRTGKGLARSQQFARACSDHWVDKARVSI